MSGILIISGSSARLRMFPLSCLVVVVDMVSVARRNEAVVFPLWQLQNGARERKCVLRRLWCRARVRKRGTVVSVNRL